MHQKVTKQSGSFQKRHCLVIAMKNIIFFHETYHIVKYYMSQSFKLKGRSKKRAIVKNPGNLKISALPGPNRIWAEISRAKYLFTIYE